MRMCIDPYSCVHHALHSITEAGVWRDLSIPLTEARVIYLMALQVYVSRG
jgi:hypothetical protein